MLKIVVAMLLFANAFIYAHVASAITTYPPSALLQPNDITSSHIRDGQIQGVDMSSTSAFTFASSTVGTLVAGTINATSTLTVGATTTFNGNTYIWPTASGTAGQLLQAQGDDNLAWLSLPTGKFGGTGVDGALAISTGTTTINLGGADYYTKNYSSISITGSGVLAFTNASTTGTYIKLLSQGECTLTSTSTPMINAIGMGGGGGAGGTTVQNAWGNNGATAANVAIIFDTTAHGGGGGVQGTGGAGGSGTFTLSQLYTSTSTDLITRTIRLFAGMGGGGGAGGNDGTSNNHSTAGGAGGAGGPVLYMECGTTWNFTTTNGISVKGANGANSAGIAGWAAGSGGGGGGGAGGVTLILYNTLTANSGSINISGGSGGTGGTGGTGGAGAGGGGSAGNLLSAGATGSNGSGFVGGTGATGKSGYSIITKNLWWY